MASSATSVENGSWWHGEGGSRRSPIPYRTGPLDYTPYVACKCGQKAALWISWSDKNPGRRYLKCYRARSGGCDFISWFEGRADPFVRGLLVDLRNAVWDLKRERADLKEQLSEAVNKIEEQKLKMGRLLVAMEEGGACCRKAESSEMVAKKRPWLIPLCVVLAAICLVHFVSA